MRFIIACSFLFLGSAYAGDVCEYKPVNDLGQYKWELRGRSATERDGLFYNNELFSYPSSGWRTFYSKLHCDEDAVGAVFNEQISDLETCMEIDESQESKCAGVKANCPRCNSWEMFWWCVKLPEELPSDCTCYSFHLKNFCDVVFPGAYGKSYNNP